jgi:transposase
VRAAREAWPALLADVEAGRLVFIDESGAKTNMARLYGRAPRGERVVARLPHGHWKTTTMISAVRLDGPCACATLDGPVDADTFLAYVTLVLAPALRPGDVVVLDNLAAHKAAGVVEAVNAAGASVLYLPPYSPDLNPIELAFAKLKQLMRSAGHRTMAALWSDVQRMLDRITASDAAGFLRHCGYTLRVE